MADQALDNHTIMAFHGRTFHGFTLGVKWFCLHLATLLTLLVISFCTPAGLGIGIVAAVVVMAVGVYAMNHGLNHSTEHDSIGP
ncbi:MAG TPA: aa3-type cytochrome c oxidase subunit IV [Caulobacteraceae bacterium]|jgi:hypothetical protein|nr:aa3-type cytochrome c oxidase subunit IV [Caulobacteraceae bacterium]